MATFHGGAKFCATALPPTLVQNMSLEQVSDFTCGRRRLAVIRHRIFA